MKPFLNMANTDNNPENGSLSPVIKVDGGLYQPVPQGSYHCSDCDLFGRCHRDLDEVPCLEMETRVIYKRVKVDMTISEYQKAALSTAIYPKDREIDYLTLALCGEAGELADKVKKVIRDHEGDYTTTHRHAIAEELGDVMWYAANLANAIGYDLEGVCKMNIDKIESRRRRGKIHGEGDNR